MPYHIRPDEPLIAELRLVADDQLVKALTSAEMAQNRPDEAIHDLRKRMKKLRGLLRLVRPGQKETFARRNRELRDIARRFSAIRDTQVRIETAESLMDGTSGETRDRLAAVLDLAERERDRMRMDDGLDKHLEWAVERLTDMRERVADWTLEGQDTQILRAGLKKTYGRARKAFRQARDDGGQTQLHDWRKRVKYHGYHCRLLREAWPDTMRARIRSLDDLSTCLGDERDYQQFRRWLNSPQSGLSPESAACAAELAARRAERLREAAFATAPRLLEEKKGALARRITGYWASAPAIDRKSR